MTLRSFRKRPRERDANLSCTMESQAPRTVSERLFSFASLAALCVLGIGASAVAGATSASAVVPQQSLDDAWWTGPLLAPSAGTLPRGHWLVEPYVFDVMTYGYFDRNGTRRSTGAAHELGNQTYIEYGLADRFTLG